MKRCVICNRPNQAPSVYLELCRSCCKAFAVTDGCDMITVIAWVAKRTRYFERRRK